MRILKYEDSDDSIILKSTLASEAAITSPEVGRATSSIGTNQTFISGGMRIDTGGGGAKFVDLVGAGPLDNAGQISIDVLTSFVGWEDSTELSGSQGSTIPDTPTHKYFLEWDDGGANFGRLGSQIVTGEQVVQWYAKSGETNGAACVNTVGKDIFTRLTVSWNGSQMVLFIDGKPLERSVSGTAFRNSTRVAYYSNLFKDIYVGAYQAAATGPAVDCIFKNLLISTQPVSLPRLHGLGNVALWGHSFVMSYGGYDDVNIGDKTEGSLVLEIEKIFANRGVGLKPIATSGLGGGSVSDATANDLSTTIAKNGSTNLLDYNPDYVVAIVGTNDVINHVTIDASGNLFEDELKLRIDEIFGGAGGENIKGMVLCTIPTLKYAPAYDTAAMRTARAAYNASINLMPAYAVAQRYSEIVIADIEIELGGETPSKNYFLGQLDGHATNLHLSMLGNQKIAGLIINKLNTLI